jgi:hypothetical protein
MNDRGSARERPLLCRTATTDQAPAKDAPLSDSPSFG